MTPLQLSVHGGSQARHRPRERSLHKRRLGASEIPSGIAIRAFATTAASVAVRLFDQQGRAQATHPLAPQGAGFFAGEIARRPADGPLQAGARRPRAARPLRPLPARRRARAGPGGRAALPLAPRPGVAAAAARARHLRAARRHLHPGGHLRGRAASGCPTLAELGRDRHRADAARRPSPARAAGATTAWRCSRRSRAYGTPDELRALRRRGARAGARGAAGRGLQPLRPGRQLPSAPTAPTTSPTRSERLGRRAQLRPPGGAPADPRQRALLAERVPLRWPAPGRRPRHRRSLAPRTSCAELAEAVRARCRRRSC